MTASKRFANVVAKCRANFEKNSAAHRTDRRMWDPRTPGMNHPMNAWFHIANYFKFLHKATKKNGCLCCKVNPDNAQKLRWCGLVETRKVNGRNRYFATALGHEYIQAFNEYYLGGNILIVK